jgi:hypothetical protein
LRVNGKLDASRENPGPLTVAAVTVTAAVPVELKVSDCVAAVSTLTSPYVTELELMESVGVELGGEADLVA